MAIIPSFFMDAVVALGVEISDGKKLWVGTGFLVGRKEKTDPSRSTIYIITNKHVVNNQSLLHVRFNNTNGLGVKDLRMQLENSAGKIYSEHPAKEVDIVAIQILPQVIIDHNLSLSFFDEDDHALSLAQMKRTGVEEGSLIYALGFPMNLVGDLVKAPICRLGCISRVADAFIDEKTACSFLVDAQTFPGNSGGPIVSRPEHISIDGTPSNTNANLIGILSAYIPYRETLYSRQTGRDRMIQEENSGLTIVHPVDRIKEVIELEWERIEKQKAANNAANFSLPQEAKEEAFA
jgi:S1-C subfamily serine protease